MPTRRVSGSLNYTKFAKLWNKNASSWAYFLGGPPKPSKPLAVPSLPRGAGQHSKRFQGAEVLRFSCCVFWIHGFLSLVRSLQRPPRPRKTFLFRVPYHDFLLEVLKIVGYLGSAPYYKLGGIGCFKQRAWRSKDSLCTLILLMRPVL